AARVFTNPYITLLELYELALPGRTSSRRKYVEHALDRVRLSHEELFGAYATDLADLYGRFVTSNEQLRRHRSDLLGKSDRPSLPGPSKRIAIPPPITERVARWWLRRESYQTEEARRESQRERETGESHENEEEIRGSALEAGLNSAVRRVVDFA